MCAMIITGVIGCVFCILAPVLMWVAYVRMNEATNIAGIASLLIGEILVWVYLVWFLVTRV